MRSQSPVPARELRIFRLATLFTVVTIALGSMVCATDSSSACPAWPVCYADQVGPQVQSGWLENPAIEFIHRAISFACLVLLGYAGWLGRRYADVRLRVLPWVALACAIGSAVFGMMIILFTLPLGLAVLDLGFAFVAMVLIVVATQAASGQTTGGGDSRVRALAGSTVVTLIAMHLLGAIVAGRTADGFASFTRCVSWPMWQILDIDGSPALQGVRIGLAGLAVVLIVAACVLTLPRPHLRAPAMTLVALLVVELALGVLIRVQGLAAGQTNGIDAPLAVAYAVIAVGVLWASAWLFGRALPERAPQLDARTTPDHAGAVV